MHGDAPQWKNLNYRYHSCFKTKTGILSYLPFASVLECSLYIVGSAACIFKIASKKVFADNNNNYSGGTLRDMFMSQYSTLLGHSRVVEHGVPNPFSDLVSK